MPYLTPLDRLHSEYLRTFRDNLSETRKRSKSAQQKWAASFPRLAKAEAELLALRERKMKLLNEIDAVMQSRYDAAKEIVLTQGMKNVTVNGEQYNPRYDMKGRIILNKQPKERKSSVVTVNRLRERLKLERTKLNRRPGAGGVRSTR
jgi:hypothetical protein